MKDTVDPTRRRVVQSLAVTGLGGLGGCLRLTEPSDGDGGSASSTGEAFATLYAFDPSSGSVKWSHDTNANGLETRFECVERMDDSIYYAAHGSGSGDDQRPAVRSLDIETGDTEWEYELSGGFVSGMTAGGGSVFVFMGGEVFELDADSGEEVQKTSLLFPAFDGLATNNGVAYVIGYDEGIRAYDIAAGETVWQNPEVTRDSNAPPLVTDDTIYYGTEGGYLLAVDRESGSKKWDARVDGGIERQPAVSEDHTWVVDSSSSVYGFEKSAGEEAYRISSGVANSGRRLAATNDAVAFKGDSSERETVAYQIAGSGDFQESWTSENTLKSYSKVDAFVLGRQQLRTYDAAGEETWSTDEVAGIARLNQGKAVHWDGDEMYAGFVRPE